MGGRVGAGLCEATNAGDANKAITSNGIRVIADKYMPPPRARISKTYNSSDASRLIGYTFVSEVTIVTQVRLLGVLRILSVVFFAVEPAAASRVQLIDLLNGMRVQGTVAVQLH